MFSDSTQSMNSSNPCDLISQLDLCCPPIVYKGFFPNCMEEWIIGEALDVLLCNSEKETTHLKYFLPIIKTTTKNFMGVVVS